MLIKKNSQLLFVLKKEFGIGIYKSSFLLTLCGFNINFNCKYNKFLRLRLNRRLKKIYYIKNWILTDRLKYRRKQYFIFIKLLQNYKYFRFKFGLPVRGQRTHSNKQNNYKFSISIGLMKLSANQSTNKKKYKMLVTTIKKKKSVKSLKNILLKKKNNFVVLN